LTIIRAPDTIPINNDKSTLFVKKDNNMAINGGIKENIPYSDSIVTPTISL